MWHTDQGRPMLPRLLHLHPSTFPPLIALSKEAERDGAYRVAKRLQAVVLNAEGRTSGELAAILKAPRSKVSEWLALSGPWSRRSAGRISIRTATGVDQRSNSNLGDILDSGPVAYGLDNGVWTSPMIAWVIEEEFGVSIIPGMCANCFTAGDFRCSGHGAYWRGPTPRRRTDGIDASIHSLKKSPLAKLGLDLYRRSQFPAGLDLACHLEPGGPPAGSPRHRRTQEREDSRRHRTLANSFPLPRGDSLQRLQLPGLFGTVGRRYRRQGAILIQDNASYHKDAEVWIGSGPTAIGWRCINCRPTRRSSIPPSGCGNTRARTELTTDTLPAGRTCSTTSDSRLWRDAVPPCN